MAKSQRGVQGVPPPPRAAQCQSLNGGAERRKALPPPPSGPRRCMTQPCALGRIPGKGRRKRTNSRSPTLHHIKKTDGQEHGIHTLSNTKQHTGARHTDNRWCSTTPLDSYLPHRQTVNSNTDTGGQEHDRHIFYHRHTDRSTTHRQPMVLDDTTRQLATTQTDKHYSTTDTGGQEHDRHTFYHRHTDRSTKYRQPMMLDDITRQTLHRRGTTTHKQNKTLDETTLDRTPFSGTMRR